MQFFINYSRTVLFVIIITKLRLNAVTYCFTYYLMLYFKYYFMLYFLVIEQLPVEFRERFTEMREMDLQVQSKSCNN